MNPPNLFIVGTTKGGTSTLHRWLRQHPAVYLPNRKEMHHFCQCPPLRGPSKAVRDVAAYEKYFDGVAAAVSGEASPCYMYYPDVAAALAARYPDARIVISLRDPADRFWSHYLMNEVYRPTGQTPTSIVESNMKRGFSNAVEDLVGVGMYCDQVSRFISTFGRKRVHVMFLEELTSDPRSAIREVEDFLGLPHEPIDTTGRDKEYVEPRHALGRLTLRNRKVRAIGVALLPWRIRRYLRSRVLGDPSLKPNLPHDLRSRLHGIYVADVICLEKLLRRPLPWEWHRSR